MIPVEYAQNIIVGVIFQTKFEWYVSEKEIWFLDLKKHMQAYTDKGYPPRNPDDFSGRFDIPIVNEETAQIFLKAMEQYKVKRDELSDLLITTISKTDREEDDIDDLLDFVPSLFVDFDTKRFLSSFPEPASFEYYVPDGWFGEYKIFAHELPLTEKYWVINGVDYFK